MDEQKRINNEITKINLKYYKLMNDMVKINENIINIYERIEDIGDIVKYLMNKQRRRDSGEDTPKNNNIESDNDSINTTG